MDWIGLENPYGQSSLAGYRPWGHREPDMSEQLRTELDVDYSCLCYTVNLCCCGMSVCKVKVWKIWLPDFQWKWKSLSRVRLFATPWTVALTKILQNTGVGSLSLLQGIFPTGIEPRSPTLQADSLPAEPQGHSIHISQTSDSTFLHFKKMAEMGVPGANQVEYLNLKGTGRFLSGWLSLILILV